jgi:hypothetical protein
LSSPFTVFYPLQKSNSSHTISDHGRSKLLTRLSSPNFPRKKKPKHTQPTCPEQYLGDGHPIVYWIQMCPKYPCLSQLAIDILTIPASSCDCERLFSELGDLLEPKRRAIGSELLAALQLLRSWTRAGFKTQDNKSTESNIENNISDEHIVRDYIIHEWNIKP